MFRRETSGLVCGMSTAPRHAISPAFAHAQARERGHAWERILAVLIICLPIPLLAATGLSIPLPAGVERIGATLVAWADESDGSSPLGEAGAIVLADAEQAAPDLPDRAGVTLHRSVAAGGPQTGSTAPADGPAGGAKPTKENDTGGGNGGGGNGGGGSGPPDPGGGDPGGGDPGDDPGLVEGTVKEITETTEPVVDEVESTVDDVLPTNDLLPDLGK
jgi:hypothetical protein